MCHQGLFSLFLLQKCPLTTTRSPSHHTSFGLPQTGLLHPAAAAGYTLASGEIPAEKYLRLLSCLRQRLCPGTGGWDLGLELSRVAGRRPCDPDPLRAFLPGLHPSVSPSTFTTVQSQGKTLKRWSIFQLENIPSKLGIVLYTHNPR